ncbi:NTF2-like protein [Auricularia subglabra TFB-10046 SS5]|uniref:NTF2-like protein n=1 Tax=Auricularia subglabra (strain TFB-10046 / SS5) TaxID=717982 RepID=J0D0B1_AURST|nr:NTF2-like protein [Auricularia subglabra TFB-10046 SS5]
MIPAPSSQARPPKHAFSKAVRGIMDQSGDTQMKDSTGSQPRARRPAPYGRRPQTKDADAMQVEKPGRAGQSTPKLSSRLSMTGRRPGSDPRAVAATKSRLPAHEMWREFIKSRYNAQARFLDLSKWSNDPILKKYHLSPPGSPGSTGKEGQVIFKLAKALNPTPLTISFANNGLTSLTPLISLDHFLPDTRNISLEGNELKTFRDVEPFASNRKRLNKLRELILIGNPLREGFLKSGRAEHYQSEIIRRFPTLEILDGSTIAKISFDAPSTSAAEAAAVPIPQATTFPVAMNPGLIAPDVQTLVGEFLTRFFGYFDNSRSSLAAIYDPNATFSYSVNTAIPARAKVQGLHNSKDYPNQRKLEWSQWLTGSRNLSRARIDQAMEALHMGTAQIGEALAKIPATRHDLTKGGTFVADATTIDGAPCPGGVLLKISVHGQFTEVSCEGVRSFDRTFILAPATPGTPAHAAGWPVVILSDQLVIRALSSCEAWAPGPLTVQSVEGEQPPPPVLDAILAGLPEQQRVLVMELMARTRLVTQAAGQCLEGNGWDLGKALANFEAVKNDLPREAFVQ